MRTNITLKRVLRRNSPQSAHRALRNDLFDFVFFVSLWLILLLNGKFMWFANNLKYTLLERLKKVRDGYKPPLVSWRFCRRYSCAASNSACCSAIISGVQRSVSRNARSAARRSSSVMSSR